MSFAYGTWGDSFGQSWLNSWGVLGEVPETVSGGWYSKRWKEKRRHLITVRGARFVVDEDDLPRWIEEKEEEIIERVIEKKHVTPRIVKNNKNAISVKSDDLWLKSIVSAANARIHEKIVLEYAKRREVEFAERDDEEIILLMVA